MKCYDCKKIPDQVFQWDIDIDWETSTRQFIFLCKDCFEKRIKKTQG